MGSVACTGTGATACTGVDRPRCCLSCSKATSPITARTVRVTVLALQPYTSARAALLSPAL